MVILLDSDVQLQLNGRVHVSLFTLSLQVPMCSASVARWEHQDALLERDCGLMIRVLFWEW